MAYLEAHEQRVQRNAKENVRCHQLRVEFNWVVTQLGSRYSLQTLTALWQVRVALDPAEAVHVDT